jgi:hypothetical protein
VCEVLTPKAITDTIIWDATQCSLVKSYEVSRKSDALFFYSEIGGWTIFINVGIFIGD